MRRSTAGSRGGRGALLLVGSVGGLFLALLVMVNLHVWAGLEQGYAATPQQVWDRSVLLAVLDVAVLVAGPLLGALGMRVVFRVPPGPGR